MAFAFNPTEAAEESTVPAQERQMFSAGVLTRQF
jgi:hypothetical protein